MKNAGGNFSTLLGEFDSSKGDLRLVNVSSGAGGDSYMSFKKAPQSLEKFCACTNARLKGLPGGDTIGNPAQASMRISGSSQSTLGQAATAAWRGSS